MAAAKLMVISSVMEGGANVVSEACRIGLPILASDIPGNIGLLGEDYPGYFKTGDSQSLAQRIRHCYEEPALLPLQEQISLKSNKFAPQGGASISGWSDQSLGEFIRVIGDNSSPWATPFRSLLRQDTLPQRALAGIPLYFPLEP